MQFESVEHRHSVEIPDDNVGLRKEIEISFTS